ncbi:MAG: 30S ribosomal protein S8e [Candidatus Marsarchaeota archaeon]|nr:30S ribosomal protein S8e [Candidatus Marsarchaeota archaeon]MCL5115143.1 30S ribosomal protein S8e [Candidatus Marsarchaeota archaeon]
MSQFGVQLHSKSSTKSNGNGKRITKSRDKRRSEIGSYFAATRMSDNDALRPHRMRGGRVRMALKRVATVNLLTKAGYKKTKIKGVLESRDNRNFARQNIITKGTIINTDEGKAEVINRPGRDGSVNARLVEA